MQNKPLNQIYMEENQEMAMIPRIGDPAPEFHAHTTQGRINFPGDYKGSWVILFSHPADFTPVCTTEFMTFAAMEKKFAQANCKLVGLSVDGLFSHIAWLRTIKEKIEYRGMKDLDINFPVIDDVSMKVAKKYGMIQSGESSTKTVRAVFFVNPKGIINAIIYYPGSVGRNFDELFRVIVALQVAEKYNVAMPADWRPGDDVVIAPGHTYAAAKERMEQQEDGLTCYDWFFCTQKLPVDKISALFTKE
jgi:peroxiredoxin (alkyl hydroperoxide reductase subunit C)